MRVSVSLEPSPRLFLAYQGRPHGSAGEAAKV